MGHEQDHINLEYERRKAAINARNKRKADALREEHSLEIIALERWRFNEEQKACSPAAIEYPTKEKFGTLQCDAGHLYSLVAVDYKIIFPMPIEDFKQTFSGNTDPRVPIYCKNVTLFMEILQLLQETKQLPHARLNQAIYDQCLNRNGKKIKKRSIEVGLSKSRAERISPTAKAIFAALKIKIER